MSRGHQSSEHIEDVEGRQYHIGLAPGEVAPSFAMNYVVNTPLEQVGNTYVLPKLQTGLGFTPIPEPGAGALVGMGLALLATIRRLRS